PGANGEMVDIKDDRWEKKTCPPERDHAAPRAQTDEVRLCDPERNEGDSEGIKDDRERHEAKDSNGIEQQSPRSDDARKVICRGGRPPFPYLHADGRDESGEEHRQEQHVETVIEP